MRRIIQTNSVSGLCLTKIDVLDGLNEIKVCKSYKEDQKFDFGECMSLENVSPVYGTLKGWRLRQKI